MFEGLASYFFLIAMLFTILPLVIVVVLLMLATRRDAIPDARGRRPLAVYLFSTIFVGFLVLLTSVGFLAAAVGAAATGDETFGGGQACSVSTTAEYAPPDPEFRPDRQPLTRCVSTGPRAGALILRASLVALLAAGLLAFHVQETQKLLAKEASMSETRPEIVVRRAYQIYLYAVCFVTVLVLLFAASQAVYGLVRIAAPGTTTGAYFAEGGGRTIFEDAERDRGLRDLLQNLILGGFALVIFTFHWQRSVELRAELDHVVTSPPDTQG